MLVDILKSNDDTLGWEAAHALEAIGMLDSESIRALASKLDAKHDVAFQSAATLIRRGQVAHPLVQEVIEASPRAANILERTRRFVEKSGRSAEKN